MKKFLLSILCLLCITGISAQTNILSNPSFEEWNGDVPVAWGGPAGHSATISQSTDAYNGSYSVVVNGSTANKRLASQSYVLAAGTYTFSIYYKANGSEAGHCRIGYVPVTNGQADSKKYTYEEAAASAAPADWALRAFEFTLTEQTEVAFVVMNNKAGNGASFLVDNASLTTSDGSISGGDNEEEEEEGEGNEPQVPTEGEYLNETFATSLGSFTTQEVIGSYPWVFAANYGAKASGYSNGASQDAESWLISPAMDLSKETEANIAFDYVINKGDINAAADNHKLLITSNYTGDVTTTEWVEVDFGAVNNNNWTFHNTGEIALPESMMGKSAVVVAFKYMSTTANSSTWEIKNVVVKSGKGTTVDPEKPGEGEPEEPETPSDDYINETFSSDFGVFTSLETVGNFPWVIDYQTAKASSYSDGENNPATSWLISKSVDFTAESAAYVSFDYIIRYSESGKVAENHQLLISADFSGDATTATWTNLPYNAVEGSDWTTFYKAEVNVPAEFLGKSSVVFALRYTATTKASTWEVKNFKVASGVAAEPEEPEELKEHTVAEAIAAFTGVATPIIVKGYIVGAIDGKSITDNAVFDKTVETMTNLLIADSSDETDIAKCLPVQLPSGAVRTALNLVENPENYHKQVILTGNLEKYFGTAGLKGVKQYEFTSVTGIEEVKGENNGANVIFDLTGRCVEKITVPGIYIINGKKNLVK